MEQGGKDLLKRRRFFERRIFFRARKPFYATISWKRLAAAFFGGVAICWFESCFFKNPWKLAAGSHKWRFGRWFPFSKVMFRFQVNFSGCFQKHPAIREKKQMSHPKKTELRRGSQSWSIHFKYIKVRVFKNLKLLIPYESFGTHLSSAQNVWLTFHWILIDNIGSLCLLQSS